MDSVQVSRQNGTWGALLALAEADGTAGHRHVARLITGVAVLRDLADAVHLIAMLHGRHPGVIEHATLHTHTAPAQQWLAEAGDGFAIERAHLVRIVAAAGPLPSTPGQAETETAVTAQRHALDMLAQSDRTGCAMGAAVGLALDWTAIRAVLDIAADRLGLDPIAITLPPRSKTADVIDAVVEKPAVERALLFGAQQLLAQHRGLWDLLEARASARARH